MEGVRVDPVKLKEVKTLLSGIKGGTETALMRAINRSLTGIRTDAVKEIAKEVNLKSKVIRETIVLKKAGKGNMRAYLVSTHAAVPAYDKTKAWKISTQAPGMHYGGRKMKKGFSFQFKKGRARTAFKSAFVATMASGHTGIWLRTGKGRTIKEIYSSSPTEVLSNKARMEPILKAAGDRLTNALDQQVKYLLGL